MGKEDLRAIEELRRRGSEGRWAAYWGDGVVVRDGSVKEGRGKREER